MGGLVEGGMNAHWRISINGRGLDEVPEGTKGLGKGMPWHGRSVYFEEGSLNFASVRGLRSTICQQMVTQQNVI